MARNGSLSPGKLLSHFDDAETIDDLYDREMHLEILLVFVATYIIKQAPSCGRRISPLAMAYCYWNFCRD